MNNECIYWMALAHLPKWTQERKNSLVFDILLSKKITLQNFFGYDEKVLKSDFNLTDKECSDIKTAKEKLPNLAFQAEKLLSEGFKIIPLNSELYPKTMKENLKRKYAPTILYTKGDINIFKEDSVAVVGCREANEDALNFTDNIAKKMAEEYKVVVSGGAKGVDKQALDSSIKYNGNSIIVLPQGITTFDSGFRKYYQEINKGSVIVVSTYPPDAGWSTGNAMGRNVYIYGLAKRIYVAQTNDSGGTWNGAIDGLRKNRDVFVYYPKSDTESAAYKLIQKGAKAVDFDGNVIKTEPLQQVQELAPLKPKTKKCNSKPEQLELNL